MQPAGSRVWDTSWNRLGKRDIDQFREYYWLSHPHALQATIRIFDGMRQQFGPRLNPQAEEASELVSQQILGGPDA